MTNIIFDCERMKYDETGIYHYCMQIGKRIGKRLRFGEHIIFYTPGTISPVWGRHIRQRKMHKFFTPPLPARAIWHSTYQHSDYLPSARQKVPVLLTVHDLNFMYDEELDPARKERYLENLQKRVDRSAMLVCVSDHSRKDVVAHCQLRGKPVHVIHNGSNELAAAALSDTSFRPAKPFIFSVGAIRRKKNFQALFELIGAEEQLELVIAGKPEEADYAQELRIMARDRGLGGRVHLVGKISEPEKSWYYQHCTAFALTSLAEGFSLPSVEAMSTGKPVFLSDRTALPEIGGDAAFYFSDFSARHMQQVFQTGMERYHTSEMADRIRERAGRFSWDFATDQYIELYRQLYTDF